MALSAKRPSRGNDARKRILHGNTETTEEKKRLNAQIEETLYRKIKVRAVEEGRSIPDITRDLWSERMSV
ncbi:hypothetical protein [Roseobacter weihaiensis]|uniref:hypothetical protein n=1 Tax=Roseobacter weihaiensis TaxID=2763262 RepID=UPI001D0B8B4C|nr:hypothetical protein [Roseobacter sp. H9]